MAMSMQQHKELGSITHKIQITKDQQSNLEWEKLHNRILKILDSRNRKWIFGHTSTFQDLNRAALIST